MHGAGVYLPRSLQKTYLRGPTRTRIRVRQLNSFSAFMIFFCPFEKKEL